MVSSDHLLLELGLWSLVIVTQSDSLLIMVFAQGSVLGAYENNSPLSQKMSKKWKSVTVSQNNQILILITFFI